jgi:phage gp36-like protein
VADVGAIDEAILFADDLVDSYLSTRYSTPVDSTPLVVGYAGDIAVYKIANTADVLTEEIAKRYGLAVSWLKDISASRASLPGAVVPSASVETSLVETCGNERLFTRRSMRGL